MEFLKKNYEKILLAVVFLGLVAAVVLLLLIIPLKQQRLKDYRDRILNPRVKLLDPPDLSVEIAAFQRAQSPDQLDYTAKHKLFNPVLWQMAAGGRLRKIDSDNQYGPGALQILAIKPLYLRVVYDSPTADGYLIQVYHEAAARSSDRQKNTIVSSNGPSDIFNLISVTGPPDNPPQLQMEFKDTHEPVLISPDKSYERVEGYTADLQYPPEPNQPPWLDQRVGDRLRFEGAEYIVIAITQNTVVVSSRENNKKTTINFSPTTPPR
jgi:hypothetical protein